MLKLENVNVAYGSTQVLWDINIEVNKGEIVCIVGSNGAGKTTMARAASGLLHIMSGSIKYMGEEIANKPTHYILQKGFVHVPEGRQLFTEMTVYENLEMGALSKEARAKMPESLEKVYNWFPRLRERASQTAGTLSGGEQQMLAISRGFMSLPKLILFDEPSLGLAPNVVESIMCFLRDLIKEGITVILIEQDVRKALRNSERAYVLENGVIRLSGKASDLMNNDDVRKAYLGL